MPTTVLAQQHYQTFSERLAPYPARVDVVSRFRTPAELRHIRADLDGLMDASEDRLHILALDPRSKPRCLGRACTFRQNYFTIV